MTKDLINIEKIIGLGRQQDPNSQNLIKALQNCAGGHWTSKGYYSFVDSTNSNQVGAEWQFDENIILEQYNEGNIVIDFLKDKRIGGIEFVKFLT